MVLGQPLNFSVQLRADSGEPITPECIAAEVSEGNRRVPAAQVRTALESLGPEGARVRVMTTRPVDDRVVGVQLDVGCQTRVTRRYMLTAEPAARAERPATARAATAGPRLRLDAAEPVLSEESAAVEQAIEVVAQAATAMRAAMAAASAAEERIGTLEQSVEQARRETRSQRELVLRLQAEAVNAVNADSWLWPLRLAVVALALLSAALAWRLWQRSTLAARRPERHEAPALAVDGLAPDPGPRRPPPAPAPTPTPAPAPALVLGSVRALPPDPPPPRPAAMAAAPSSAPGRVAVAVGATASPQWATPVNQRTAPLPAGGRDVAEVPRDVSIEELIDLEQQAEFFVVLGQDAAAIDLLVDHLRLTGGGSPLPYLKLMEIYHRLGDQEAYGRTRNRFNERFNAYAPAWEEGLQQGRGLEGYPGVLLRLTQVWDRPLDAMAELEALLFRKSRGDLFDLPAYREVLFLYAIARDLFDRESGDFVNVDLLLPLHAQGDMHSTRPAPFDDAGCAPQGGGDDAEGRPTAPVDLDLDLSMPDRAASIFEPAGPGWQRSRR